MKKQETKVEIESRKFIAMDVQDTLPNATRRLSYVRTIGVVTDNR